ncbi:hypothetical protein D9M68_786250 [compost metagenome]
MGYFLSCQGVTVYDAFDAPDTGQSRLAALEHDLQYFPSVFDDPAHLAGLLLKGSDRIGYFRRRANRTFRQRSHLVGNDRESSSCIARACSLDRRV